MSRAFFKTSLLHSCHSPEMNEPYNPKRCRCRKYVSREQANQLVKLGAADWMIDYSGEFPVPSWDLTLYGRKSKTPRAASIEKAHIERAYCGRDSDQGAGQKLVEDAAAGGQEERERIEYGGLLTLEARLSLFPEVTAELKKLKDVSDGLNKTITEAFRGPAAVALNGIVKSRSIALKAVHFKEDSMGGGAVLRMIGLDQRTCVGKDTSV